MQLRFEWDIIRFSALQMQALSLTQTLKLVDRAMKMSSIDRTKERLCALLFLQLNAFHTRVDSFEYNREHAANFRHTYEVP